MISKKVVMEGTGAKAGGVDAWGSRPGQISAITLDPLMRSLMSQTAADRQTWRPWQAGVPIARLRESRPVAEGQTRVLESGTRNSREDHGAGDRGEGHFPVSRKDPKRGGFH